NRRWAPSSRAGAYMSEKFSRQQPFAVPAAHIYRVAALTGWAINIGPGLDLLLLLATGPGLLGSQGVRSGRQFPLQPLHLLCQLDPTFGDQLEIASLDWIILGLAGSLPCLDCPSSILLWPCKNDSRKGEAGNSPAKSVVGLLTTSLASWRGGSFCTVN